MTWWHKRKRETAIDPQIVAAHEEAIAAKEDALKRQPRLKAVGKRLDEFHEKNHISERLDAIFGGNA